MKYYMFFARSLAKKLALLYKEWYNLCIHNMNRRYVVNILILLS